MSQNREFTNSMSGDSDENIDQFEKIYRNLAIEKEDKFKADFYLETFKFSGILISIIGFLLFTLSSLRLQLSYTQLLSIVVAITGVLLSIISVQIKRLRRLQYDRTNFEKEVGQSLIRFLNSWIDFERIAKGISSEEMSKSFDKVPISEAIRALHESNYIDSKDLNQIKNSLSLRNELVHKGVDVKSEIIKNETANILDIIKKIEARYKRYR